MPRGLSRQPSPYPWLVFHGLRVMQFISSAIVTGMLSFFCHYLVAERYYIPWTFIVLLTVSALSIVSIVVTAVFYHNRTLKPRLSIYINIGLSLLWTLGFALLYWNLSGTLSHSCNIENWGNDSGVMVCQIYKALAAFTLFGMLSTLLCLALDFYVQRNMTSRGMYDAMGGPLGQNNNASTKLRPRNDPYTNLEDPYEAHRGLPEGEQLAISDWDSEIKFPGAAAGGDSKKPYAVNRPYEAGKFGYAHPEEQTRYDGAGGY